MKEKPFASFFTFHWTLEVRTLLVLGQGHCGQAQEERRNNDEQPHDVMRVRGTLTNGVRSAQCQDPGHHQGC